MEDFTVFLGAGGVAVVVGLVEVVKRLLALSPEWEKRVMPLTALILGIGFNALVSLALGTALNWPIIIVFGIIAGLASSGLYSSGKAAQGK